MKSIRRITLTPAGSGFTLLELMVVIVILGILAMVVAPRIMQDPEKAKVTRAKMDIEALSTAVNRFKLDVGHYPTAEQGLAALVTAPSNAEDAARWSKGGYLEKKKVPKDPWGHEYVYASPGVHGDFDITSYGADGQAGGEDFNADINSWEIE